jgi:hypothetical protein
VIRFCSSTAYKSLTEEERELLSAVRADPSGATQVLWEHGQWYAENSVRFLDSERERPTRSESATGRAPRDAAEIARRVPSCTVHASEDEGHFLLIPLWPEILERSLAHR